MSLPEFEREDIIATRKEQMHERETRKQVAKMAARTGGPSGGADSDEEEEEDDDDDEEYSSRGTRSRKAVGASSTKNEGLEKLKRSRAEKGKKKEKKKVRKHSLSLRPSSELLTSDSSDRTLTRTMITMKVESHLAKEKTATIRIQILNFRMSRLKRKSRNQRRRKHLRLDLPNSMPLKYRGRNLLNSSKHLGSKNGLKVSTLPSPLPISKDADLLSLD